MKLDHFIHYVKDKKYLISFGYGWLLLIASLFINYFAGTYATLRASSPVDDIVLSNIPVMNAGTIFVYGPIFVWIFVAILCLKKPNRIPFVLKSIALFIIIRSLFITLTHIGPFPDQVYIDYPSDIIGKFTFGGDLFFSAHTGLPFLMALVFGANKTLRFAFTIIAVFFGIIVLLAHLHYSIDVLSAFFITYTIYHISCHLFEEDKKMFS